MVKYISDHQNLKKCLGFSYWQILKIEVGGWVSETQLQRDENLKEIKLQLKAK